MIGNYDEFLKEFYNLLSKYHLKISNISINQRDMYIPMSYTFIVTEIVTKIEEMNYYDMPELPRE